MTKVKRISNSKISRKTRQQILDDYKYTQRMIWELLNGTSLNVRVASPDYLFHPLLYTNDHLHLGDHMGTFQYYVNIRKALESALIYGEIPKEQLPDRAPKYLERLVKR